MLKLMREQSLLAYVLFGMLIVVFAFNFGPGSGSCGTSPSEYAAKVNGEIIRRDEFGRRYGAQLESYRRQFSRSGGELSEDMIERLGLKNQIIDELINERLLAQEGRRWGLVVGDDELFEHLKKTYRVDNVDYDQYESFVTRNFDLTVTRFEQRVRDELVGQRLSEVVRDNLGVSDEELKGDYLREHDRVVVTFVRFDPQEMAAPAAPSEAEAKKALESEAEAVQAYYNKNVFSYHTPEKRQARQILVKVGPGAPEAEVAAARSKLLELKTQIEGGADFTALAKANSQDDASKDKGGDLGFVEQGQLIRPLSEAIFTLQKGKVTQDPVKTPIGLHLIQLVEIQPAGSLAFEEVKERVAREMLTERRRDGAAKAAADKLLAELKNKKKLEDLTSTEEEARDADEKGTPKKPVRYDTGNIQRSAEAIPRIGAAVDMVKELFSLTPERPLLPAPHKVGRSYFVVLLKERESPDVAKFETDKDKLRDQAIWSKRSKVFSEWLKSLRQKADVRLNPELFPPKAAEAKG